MNLEDGLRYVSKYVGIVDTVNPTDVTSKLSSMGDSYSNGGIFCTCPELGFEGSNLIYCRYGLSLPWYSVKVGDKLWIEPTIGLTERWIYTGFVDCGRDAVAPGAADQMILINDTGKWTFTLGNMSIVLDSDAKTATVDVKNSGGTSSAKLLLSGAATPKIDLISTGAITINTNSGQAITIGTHLKVTV